jgi:protein gp37
MDKSKIEWTDATWNVIRGCEKVSPGCAHCYAETLVNGRLRGDFGTLQVLADKFDQPLRWRRPRRIFVNSLSDLFWDQVPTVVVDRHFAVMALATQHQFQILTKRPDRMWAYLTDPSTVNRVLALISERDHPALVYSRIVNGTGWPLPNVWLGTSTENQPMFDKRIPDLLATPAAVRFLSIEPLLGPIDIDAALGAVGFDSPDVVTKFPPVDWVIVGGESGPKARPMHQEWVRRLRDQCVATGVPFFFKQWGEWAPAKQVDDLDAKFWRAHDWGGGSLSLWFGKKKAGRTLDGRLWDEVPKGR